MPNFFLIYGNNKSLMEREAKTIVEKLSFSLNDLIRYEYDQTNMQDIIEDAATISLFANKKVILISNCNFFGKDNADLLLFQEYLEHYNSNSYLIFLYNGSTIDRRKKVIKKLEKIGKITEFNKTDNNYLYNYAYDYIKQNNFDISKYDLNYFLDNVGSDINNITNELDKLFLYKEDFIILKEDIDVTVIKNYEDEIYSLTDAVVKNDIAKSVSLYHEFKDKNYDELMLIPMIAKRYRLLFKIKRLSNQNKSNEEIAKIIDIHPYRVKLFRDINYLYTESDLLRCLSKLANLDINIKMGLISKEKGFELFLLNKDFVK